MVQQSPSAQIKSQTHPDLFGDFSEISHDIVHASQQLITYSVEVQASDIHLEPFADCLRVRIRIDGLLHHVCDLSQDHGLRLIARFKVMAGLETTEKRRPQDGRFHFDHQQWPHDCRINTCPAIFGEKAVIRLLDPYKGALKLDELGMEPETLQRLQQALSQAQGLILVTGPTGSGKTVTLYSALNHLDTKHYNITTVEDPAEIALPGINQVSVNPKLGLDFANVLRALLRQDPDVIMLGEIRDQETAEIAIKAAQTGHLVLATLHTNHCVEAIMRLHYLGVSLANITSALRLILAQRLVRQLCCYCLKHTATQPSHTRCGYCLDGYRGRHGVFECLLLDHSTNHTLMNTQSISQLETALSSQVQPNLSTTAERLVQRGITTWQEVNRVL